MWVCASATGLVDAIRRYPGPNEAEIDAILMSVRTIHHIIKPKGPGSFEGDEKMITSREWGRGGVSLR